MELQHRDRWAPRSKAGRWAVGLAAAAVVGIALSVVGFATGVLESASSFSDSWLLTGWGVTVLAVAAAAGVAGAVAVVRDHDRSWAALLATVAGAGVLAVLIREVAQGL